MAVAAENELTYEEMMGKRQEPHLVRARHEAWTRLRAQTDDRGRPIYTLVRIASWWSMCHTTIQQAVAKMEPA